MKKISVATIVIAIFTMMIMMSTTFASDVTATQPAAVEANTNDEDSKSSSIKEEIAQSSNASETTLENLKSKEEKIAYYTEKYGDATEGQVAYWLSVAQKYSIPIFFVLLIWGAFNCFIVGNKKLQKREQGFSMIIASILGLVVFQVVPLIYAIVVAGR